MNKKGFGLNSMLFWMFVFIIALIIATIYVTKLTGQNYDPFASDYDYNNNQESENDQKKFSPFQKKEKPDYTLLEHKIESAAVKYTNDIYSEMLIGDNIQVSLKVLIGKGYLEPIYDLKDSSISCSGYIDVRHLELGFQYTPYLKCGKNYTTKGYLERLDS